jgi:signal transduction histidine kinase
LIYEYKIAHDKQPDDQTTTEQFQKVISEKELLFITTLGTDVCDTNQISRNRRQIIEDAEKNNYLLFIFHYDTLINWSSNIANPENFNTLLKRGTGFIELKNGYYLYHNHQRGTYRFLFLYKIKSNYAFKNQYIQNQFSKELSFIKDAKLSSDTTQLKHIARNVIKQAIFSYEISAIYPSLPEWLIAIAILLIVMWIGLFHITFRSLIVSNIYTTSTAFILFWLLVRYSNIILHWPVGIYVTKLFNPSVYASSNWFPSLGDLLIDSALVLWLFVLLETRLGDTSKTVISRNNRISYYVWLILSVVFCHVTVLSIKSLTIDSQISFDINNIFSINLFTYLGLMVIIIQMLVVYFVIRNLLRAYHTLAGSTKSESILAIVFVLIGYIAIAYSLRDIGIFQIAITVALFCIFFIFKYVRVNLNRFQQYFSVIFIIALFSSVSIQHWSDKKDRENRKLFAVKLISQNDITTDYFLRNVETKILSDQYVTDYFSNPLISKSQFEKRFKQLYFTGYLSKYEVSILDYDLNGFHFKERNTYSYRTIKKLYDEQSAVSINKYFRYTTGESETKGYIAQFTITHHDAPLGILYVLLKPKLIQDENRFDELLIDGFKQINRKENNYSYAVYKNRNIIYQSGDFPYRIRNTWPDSEDDYLFFEENGYEHLLYSDNQIWTAVVSKPVSSSLQTVGLFSFVFTLCTIVLILILFVYVALNSDIYQKYNGIYRWFIKPMQQLFNKLLLAETSNALYLRTRIQTSILFILFITLFCSAYFTIRFITDKYNNRQTERLMKKLRNVVLTLESENIKNYELTNNSEIEAFINQMADLYDTDITLFDNKGFAIASSISKLYDAGIVSRLMPGEAYYHLKLLKESQYINNEKIALLNFQAAYAPVFKNKGEVLGYVQLPYFSRKADLTSEISSVVVGFINLYVVLFIIIGLIAYLITRNISYPLALIQQRLSGTRLGEKNEPISWQRNDEIGELVKQYNQMIEQLEASARKLAETEREGAWREIARQIAHEIKNPLTPMKLSVQHLQRAYAQNDPNIAEKIDRTAKLLVKQIDTLSDLASEFSSFAKMPAPVYEHIDVCHEIQTIIDLYRLETQHTIEFDCNVINELNFDRSYLSRSIGNLIKNALQAIPENVEGKVRVTVTESETDFRFIISDNGTGMSEEAAAQIFKPYFSTKVSGMGLGLPIVKNMIESGNGKIYFETNPGIGTTFTILLPK